MPALPHRSDGVFSLGAVLARYWHPAYALLPWALTSAMLTVAAMWDYWSRGGSIDYVVLGLAAYELMLGLLEEQRADSMLRSSASAKADRNQDN